jgi:PST family polysaccharide transporter
LLSDWWAKLYDIPILADVIRVLALTIPIKALTVVQQAIVQRDMNFKSLAIRSNAAVIAGGVVGLTLAVSGLGVWALVGQQVANSAVGVLVLWRISDWRPRGSFSYRHLKELLSFSGQVMLGSVGLLIGKRIDVVIIGFFFGPLTVGLFRFAERLIDISIELLARPFTTVALPRLSRAQSNPETLQVTFSRLFSRATALTLPAMACLWLSGPSLLEIIGQEWLSAAGALQTLTVVGILATLTNLVGPVLYATGRPQALTKLIWIFAFLNPLGLVLVGVLFEGSDASTQALSVAWVHAVMHVLFLPANISLLRRYSGASPRMLWASLRPIGFGTIVATGLGWIALQGLERAGSAAWVTAAVVLTVVLGASSFILYLVNDEVRIAIRSLVRWRRSG